MKKFILLIATYFITMSLIAQQDMMFSQYMFSGSFLNPAYTGSHKYSTAAFLYRKQWVNVEGAPTSQFLSYDTPLKNRNVGLGGLISNDQIGVTKKTDIYGNYSYKLKLDNAERHTLSFGLRGGVSYYRANLTALSYWDKDEVFEEDINSSFMPNIGTGIYYYSERSYAGLSVPHLLNYDPETALNIKMNNVAKLVRHYYFTTGTAIELSDKLIIKPSTLVKFTPNTPIEFDFNVNLLIDEKIWIGGSYRTDDAAVAILEILATKQLRVGYSYDFPISEMNNYTSGSHEIMLAYDFGYEILKMKSPRFF